MSRGAHALPSGALCAWSRGYSLSPAPEVFIFCVRAYVCVCVLSVLIFLYEGHC